MMLRGGKYSEKVMKLSQAVDLYSNPTPTHNKPGLTKISHNQIHYSNQLLLKRKEMKVLILTLM